MSVRDFGRLLLVLVVEGAGDGRGYGVAAAEGVSRVTGRAGTDRHVVAGVAHRSNSTLVDTRTHAIVVDAVLITATVAVTAALSAAAVAERVSQVAGKAGADGTLLAAAVVARLALRVLSARVRYTQVS